MDGYQTVVEPDCNLVGLVGLEVNPGANIGHKGAYLGRDSRRFNPDVGLAEAVAASPLPYLAEHGAVEVSQVPVIE